MDVRDAKAFVTIVPHYWGKAATLADALRNMRAAGATSRKQETRVWVFDCPPDDVEVFAAVDVSLGWPKDASALRFTAKL